ncbi:glycosyltransferase [Herbaspirillum rhizosphaerae]|uniref:Glycosyltransferase n=1 Tax=Herbaspirillum rhizosphaerae TaxID=346179 RepID=A0ABW8Z832_9BURK
MDALQDNLVSLVMRTVGGRPREIRRALTSVAANTCQPIEVVIVYQGGDLAERQFLNSLQDEFSRLTIRVLHNTAVGDRRAENLNIGWEQATGRYLGFLDDDDTLEPHHCALLLAALQRSGRVWSYAQTTLRKENDALEIIEESQPFRRHSFSVAGLWTENFIPIHSFMIDRANLIDELRERPFCEALDRSEDWDFLIRLGFFHAPERVDEFTCNYYVSTGLRNTNLSLMENNDVERQERNRQAWARCKALVEQRKSALLGRVWWAQELFAGAVAIPVDGSVADEASTKNKICVPLLRSRIVRALIRRLERLL